MVAPSTGAPYSSNVSRTRSAITNRIVVESKHHRALESLRAGDQDAEASLERVSGNPGFVWATRVPAARDHGSLDALTTTAWDAFDVEDRDRHMAYCTERSSPQQTATATGGRPSAVLELLVFRNWFALNPSRSLLRSWQL